MKFCQPIIAVVWALSFLPVDGLSLFRDIFNFLGNLGNHRPSRVKATDCTDGAKNSIRCRFNSNALNLKLNGKLKFALKDNGREISCNRHTLQRDRGDWYGTCDGDAQDANFIVRSDPHGQERIYGSIRVGGEVCQIAPNANGVDEVTCIADSEFRDNDRPIHAPLARNLQQDEIADNHTYIFGFTPSTDDATDPTNGSGSLRGTQSAQHRELYDDSGSTIDIMVVWTSEAECGTSNLNITGCTLTPTTESNMRGLIQLAISETNTAFELSGVITRLRLVHAYRDPDYKEATTANSQDLAIDSLQSKTDGALDSVHAKRALYGADMVHMIVGSPGYCGLAYSGTPNSAYMFSLSRFNCATGYYSFGHELAHNMNAWHDRGTETSCSNTTTYNYGYRDPNAEFRSILAYDCAINQCDKVVKNGCPRVQRFSNPDIPYNGKAIGSASQNNARQMNEVRKTIASFFPAMNCQRDSDCNDRNAGTIDTCNLANAACVFTPGVAPTPPPPTPKITPAPINPPTPTPVAPAPIAPVPVPVVPAPTPVALAPIPVVPAPTPVAPAPTPFVAAPVAPAPIAVPPNPAPISSIEEIPPVAVLRATPAPTASPTVSQKYYMESKVVSTVTSATWSTVQLTGKYTSPIPVCTVKYDKAKAWRPSVARSRYLPAVVRMRNVGSTSFEIKLQNPSNNDVSGRDVHCVIVEAGKWKLADGRRVEAKQYASTVTDRKSSWVGQQQSYDGTFVAPIVLGQVMTFNDPKWSVFWSRGSAVSSGPSSNQIVTGKHVGEDKVTQRNDETIGYIVFESGHATSDGVEIETRRGADSAKGYVQDKYTYTFSSPFSSTPAVAIASQVAMDESDGSWAVLTSNPTSKDIALAVDEDAIGDSERQHTTEELDYAVFSVAGTIPLYRTV